MSKANKIIQFGEHVEDFEVPVLNEREIRAAAGVLFLFMFTSLMQILFKGNFVMIKYVIVVFLSDLVIRVFLSPRVSPILILARLIVSCQVPEYVAAAQKKFAWKIGIGIAGLMFLLLVVLNSYSIITGICCLICLAFLFFESAFGICLGCVAYGWFYKEKARHCAGAICEPGKKHDIQKTSSTQVLILVGLVLFVLLLFLVFNRYLLRSPSELFKASL